VEFLILGHLVIHDQGRQLPIGTPRQRQLLALLLVEPGRLVGVDQIVDELWPERPPPDARALVHGYVSRLRRALRAGGPGETGRPGAGWLVTRKPGYLVRAAAESSDLHRFERLVAEARAARAQGRHEAAAALFGRALALWRGAPFADVPPTPRISAVVASLGELRLSTMEEGFDAALAAGESGGLVGPLTEFIAAHPLRERAVGQLMLALHRTGRTAEALRVAQEAKKRLAAELGIDPGPDLQRLELAILRADPSVAAAPSAGPDVPAQVRAGLPAQLPAAVSGFAGRDALLARLDGIAATVARSPAAAVAVLSGTAGVGKTALAAHWARRVAHQFPDGQLYVDLRGFDPSGSPTPPETAIRGFLDAFGVPPGQISADLDAQAARYRSLLDGRRVLVVLDNARDAEQVRPLLPGAPGCLALVTSRDPLTGLVVAQGAQHVPVGLFSVDEARLMLAGRLGPDRLAAELAAADDVITACARLPLALAIVAARAVTSPATTVAALAAQLHAARGSLDAFPGWDDAATDVRAVFSWSYRTLRPPAARLFRLAGLHPGPDLAAPAAASLAGLAVDRAEAAVAELVRANLLAAHAPGRYAVHDLLRAYAAELAHAVDADADRLAAQRRMVDHYVQTASAADRLLYPHRDPIEMMPPTPGAVGTRFGGREEALAWFTAELPVLLATVQTAADAGLDRSAYELAWTLENVLDWRGRWRELAAAQSAAIEAAERLGDPAARAHADCGLARAYTRLARHDDAHRHLRRALDAYQRLGDRINEAHTHMHLNVVLTRQSDHAGALDHAARSLALFEMIDDLAGQARALNGMGWSESQLGRYPKALVHCGRALRLQQKLSDRPGEAATWDSLAYIQHHLGDYRQAVDGYRQAVDIRRSLGNRSQQAASLSALADTHLAAGDRARARRSWHDALTILDELGHPDAGRIRANLDRYAGPAT
jgi:DNA-binding SARP family transcriptional activator